MKITIILTGGTIDSYFDTLTDSVVPLENSCLPKYIESLKTEKEYTYITVCMKDSRELSLQDLESVRQHIDSSEEDRFIVTHGTYTMPDTARYLAQKLLGSKKDKRIILTGSMIPLTGFSPSDAGFNLGFTLACLDYIDSGVYVCMNGTLFNAHEVSKLVSAGRFISLFNN